MSGFANRGPRLAASVALAAGLVGATAPAAGQVGDAPESRAEVVQRAPDGKLRKCSYVNSSVRPIVGGCVVKARAATVFKIMTPFGRVPLAECDFRFTAHVESNGEVTLEDVATSGSNPCGDVRACREDTDPERQPWLGWIEAGDDGYALVLDACMDTCAGWFDGELVLPLERTGGAWRARAERAPLGDSGLELTGAWRLEGADLQLKPAAGP